MSVSNGQPVNAAVNNAANMSRLVNTSSVGKVDVNNVTDSTAATNGAIHTTGGAGIEKTLNVGQNANVGGDLAVTGETNLIGDLNAAQVNAANIQATGNVEANVFDANTGINTPQLDAANIDAGTVQTTGDAQIGGNLTVIGDLTVQGTTTSLNTQTLDVEDINITINKNGNDASSEGSGITVDRTGTKGSLIYAAAATSKFKVGNLGSETEIVTISDAQVLTNKDIDGGTASNTSRLTVPKDSKTNLDALTRKEATVLFDTVSKKFYGDDGSTLKELGSGGSGAGGINHISNGDAEDTTTTAWVADNVAAATRPSGAFLGSPAGLTFTNTATSPLYQTRSFVLSKDASNRQGQIYYYPFTIQTAHQAIMHTIEMDMLVDSGTFVGGSKTTDSDVIVYIYDVTNSVWIEPSNFKFYSNTKEKFTAQFQTSSNGTSYRLVFYVASTSANAYALKLDNIKVAPSQFIYGSAITDWISYTPTTAGFGTITTADFAYRRIGDSIQIRGRFAAGTVAATTASVSLPSGFVIDSLKTPNMRPSGAAWRGAVSTTTMMLPLINGGASALNFSSAVVAAATNPYTAALVNAFLNNGDTFSFETGIIPISGASSSTQMSDSGDTRPVIFVGAVNSNFAISSTTPLTMSVLKDTHGAWSTNTFTVPVAGDYKLVMITSLTAGSDTLQIYKNGASFKVGGFIDSSPRTYSVFLENLKAGDTIQVRSSSGITIVGNGNYSYSIEKVGGANQISATENIAASYYLSASGIFSTTTPINFDSREFDTHSSVQTGSNWRFVCPASGTYQINSSVNNGPAGTALRVYKNGSFYKTIAYQPNSSIASSGAIIRMNSGDYLDFRPSASVTVVGGVLANDGTSHISIIRIGL